MARKKVERKTWRDSWDFLKQQGVKVPRSRKVAPVENPRPKPGQKKFAGLTVRDRVFEEIDFQNLSLPRTLFVGCRFHGVSFANTDLNLSCLQGCEWIDCDFTDAMLIRADLRQTTLFACRFPHCELIGADLSGASLDKCDFKKAILTGACLDRTLKDILKLSAEQRDFMVDWRQEGDEGPDEDGPDEDEVDED